MTLTGFVLGSVLLTLGLWLSQGWISTEYGLFINVNLFSETTLYYLAAILTIAASLALVPAVKAYRFSLVHALGKNY